MKHKIKFRFLVIFSIISLCIGLTYRSFQNDTFYMIKLGDFIFHNGIDFKDHYSWISNLPYTYPHWLYDLFLYIVYSNFGNVGVYVSVIFFYAILGLTIYYVGYKMNKNKLLSFAMSIIVLVELSGFAAARSQVISLILFILIFYFINMLMDIGKNKYIFYICICSLLIANIHGTSWLFTFIIFLPFIGEEVIYRICNINFIKKLYKINLSNDNKILINKVNNFKKIVISFILAFLMGIFSPSRICYTYVIKIMMGDSQSFISEHLGLVLINHPSYIFYIVLLFILLSCEKIKINLRELLMILGLMLMSFISIRHLAFIYSIGYISLSVIISRLLNNKQDKTFGILLNYIMNIKIYILCFIIVLLCSIYKYNINLKKEFIPKSSYPVNAVNYIKNNLDYKNIKLYNGYNYGSYLLFNDVPVYIDSRCDLYLKEFNGMSYSIYDEAIKIDHKYKKVFNKYKITHVLLDKEQLFYEILKNDDNYRIIYQDKYFVLFERFDI